MKSGPDVFADALVPSGRICPPERLLSQQRSDSRRKKRPAQKHPRSYRPFTALGFLAHALPGYAFASSGSGAPRYPEWPLNALSVDRLLKFIVARLAAPGRWRCGNGYCSAKPKGKSNFTIAGFPLCRRHFFDSASRAAKRAFISRSSRTLNCPSNLIGHDHRNNRPGNGVGEDRRFNKWTGAALGGGRQR
jgi:hypothetical protein